MAKYNWELYRNFLAATQELGLEVSDHGNGGGCLYVEVPEEVRKNFFLMLWTPLNKIEYITSKEHWKNKLSTFKDNHTDFHLEICTKSYEHGTYSFFPFLDPWHASKDDIVRALKLALDVENFEENAKRAKLHQTLIHSEDE